MPILTVLHARVDAWADLSASAVKTRDALQMLVDYPHPITEYRFEDELRERRSPWQMPMSASFAIGSTKQSASTQRPNAHYLLLRRRPTPPPAVSAQRDATV
ncbi:hypothetical protein [Lysobacter sp. HA18]